MSDRALTLAPTDLSIADRILNATDSQWALLGELRESVDRLEGSVPALASGAPASQGFMRDHLDQLGLHNAVLESLVGRLRLLTPSQVPAPPVLSGPGGLAAEGRPLR